MIFYHGTSIENWEKIKEEEVLWGRKNAYFEGKLLDRATYLTPLKEEAACYGEVVLEVIWDPKKEGSNNYIEDCWQFREYKPIPINRIKRL